MARRKRKQPEPDVSAPAALVRGVAYALGFTAAALLLAALIAAVSRVTEGAAMWFATGGGIMGILVGSCYCGRKIGRVGWLNGGLVGVIYVVVMLLLAVLLDVSLSLRSLLTLTAGFVLGAIGGIFGLNRR